MRYYTDNSYIILLFTWQRILITENQVLSRGYDIGIIYHKPWTFPVYVKNV